MKNLIGKKLNLQGAGNYNNHPSALISEFILRADKAGWTHEEIQLVKQQAIENGVVETLKLYCNTCDEKTNRGTS